MTFNIHIREEEPGGFGMERKRMTKVLIGESLKVLMKEYPFEKITIKMITDEAGVIRPTFYNYFCDKYEVLEWIFNDNIIEKIKVMFEQGMYVEGIKLLFVCMKNDAHFYRRAFEVTGQNAFEAIVLKYLYELFLREFDSEYIEKKVGNPVLSAENVAYYYAMSLTNLLRAWLTENRHSAEDMVDAYEYLLTHSLTDFVDITNRKTGEK